jgi:hypothetical protein
VPDGLALELVWEVRLGVSLLSHLLIRVIVNTLCRGERDGSKGVRGGGASPST